MYLKEIYLENFKSFGKKLHIPLLPGFTGITGPNGSGKSNILDAVLFVLGPRSSKVIRAGKLTDLIFNGGVSKRSADYCKVSLVFDNKDRILPLECDEVTLTRFVKYANSHETEDYYSYFYINGRGSSLTEFENLLAYANITGEGYNIVQQGDVNSIVSMGSIERRKILDSIAGITKFDSDIKKSENEKIAIDGNLEKIQIILEELNSRLSQLECESKRALEHRNLEQELLLRKYQLCIKKRRSYEGELTRIKEELEKHSKEREALELELEELKKNLEIKNDKLTKIENKIAECGDEEFKELNTKIIRLREESIKAKEGMNYCSDTIEKLKEENSLVTQELNTFNKEIAKLEREKRKLEIESEESRAKYQQIEDAYRKAQEQIAKSDSTTIAIQKELVKLKKEYERLEDELKAKRIAKATHSENLERLSNELARYKENISTYESEFNNNKELIKEVHKELKGSNRNEEKLNAKFTELTENAKLLHSKLKELEPKIMRLQNYYSRLKAELSAAQTFHKGYTSAVNAILEARDRGELKGIYGTVSELGKAPKEYEGALAIAGGGRLQAIIVDNDENATKAINYLKSKKLGRATFLPLNKLLKGYPAGKALLVAKDPNTIGFAIDLLKFDEKYRNAFWYVFGSTLVMKDIESARKHLGGVRLVTLGNDLLEASGALTGGSLGKIIGFGAGETEFDKVSKDLREKLQGQESLASELSNIKAELNSIENELKSIANKRELAVNKLSILETKSKEYSMRLSGLKIEEEKLLEKLNSENSELRGAVENITEREQIILELERKKEELSKALLESTPKQLAAKSKELQQNKEDQAERLRAKESNIQTIATQLELNQQREQELGTRLGNTEKEINEKGTRREFLIKEYQRYDNELNALLKVEKSRTTELKELNKKRELIKNRITTLEKDRESCVDKINTRKDLCGRCALRQPEIEERLAEVIAELQSYEPYLKNKDEKIPLVEELKKRIQECEERIRAFGLVNLKALEEYEAESKRKESIENEVKKLIAQKEELTKVMEELKAKKSASFMKVFDLVNESFKSTYKELSDGNEGELILENPDKIFEGGLSISVKFKGKRKLRLEALSGAEKSLTALAFIFAIQDYCPSPFYILDEIDMHLDAFNSELVAKQIKNSSKRAQFVTISLRKILLKETDHLYGVVKVGHSISKIIGNVNLEAIGEDGTIAKDYAANGGN